MHPPVIGFTGRAGAGKTTAACIVVAALPHAYRLSFADPLRAMLLALGLSAEDVTTRKSDPHALLCGHTPRFALQTLGTEWGRNTLGADLWRNAAAHKVRGIVLDGGLAVLDDVRFDNEAKLIRSMRGIVVRLERPGLAPLPVAHASESGVSSALIDTTLAAANYDQLRTAVHTLIAHHYAESRPCLSPAP